MDKTAEGVIAEYQAGEYLKSIGYQILGRNVNFKGAGELDIVLKDKDTLVFVEVKYRSSKDFGHPIESVTASKVRKLIRAAELYLAANPGHQGDIRFDVISVTDGGIEHIKDAFYGRWI